MRITVGQGGEVLPRPDPSASSKCRCPRSGTCSRAGRVNNVRLPERTEPFLPYLKQDLKLFGVSLNSWLQGLFLSGDEWIKGQRAKHVLMRRVLDDLFAL